MTTLIKLFIIIALAACGYVVYLGLTESEHNNAGMIAMDAGNLVQSVTDTFKDGTNVLATRSKEKAVETAKEVTNEAKKVVSEAVDETTEKTKEVATNAVETAKVQVSNSIEAVQKLH